jgi:hypothetical protein
MSIASAFFDRRPEDVRVKAIIIAELELCNVERQILFADLVERPDHTALDEGPETFNRVGVDRADDILALGMVDHAMREVLVQALIADPLVGAEQADAVRNGLVYEAVERVGLGVFDDAGNHVALALYGADDNPFVGSRAGSGADVRPAFVFVPVASLAADECLVNFHNAGQLGVILIGQGRANAMAHIPSGLIGTEAHIPHDLQGAHSLFAVQHQVDNAKPILQRLVGVLKDRAGNVGKAIARLWRASVALPVERIAFCWGRIERPAAWASNALRPASRDQISRAGIFTRKHIVELADGHLVNGFGLLVARHGGQSLSI